MPLVQAGSLWLVQRSRGFQEQCWPEVRLPRASLGAGLGSMEPSPPTAMSSGDSPIPPEFSPQSYLSGYVRFFAANISLVGDRAGTLTDARLQYSDENCMVESFPKSSSGV